MSLFRFLLLGFVFLGSSLTEKVTAADPVAAPLHWYEIKLTTGASFFGSSLLSPRDLGRLVINRTAMIALDNLSILFRDGASGEVTFVPTEKDKKDRRVYLHPQNILQFSEFVRGPNNPPEP